MVWRREVNLAKGIIEHVGIRNSSSDFNIESNTDYITGFELLKVFMIIGGLMNHFLCIMKM